MRLQIRDRFIRARPAFHLPHIDPSFRKRLGGKRRLPSVFGIRVNVRVDPLVQPPLAFVLAGERADPVASHPHLANESVIRAPIAYAALPHKYFLWSRPSTSSSYRKPSVRRVLSPYGSRISVCGRQRPT